MRTGVLEMLKSFLTVFKALAILAIPFVSVSARADNGPVVVELFTSQGCSSCPPADEILSELAGRDDVIALALHVDYWDYIGWKDTFGDHAYTQRQHGYAYAKGDTTVYTPQFVVGGADHVVGARTMDLMGQIRRHESASEIVEIELVRRGTVAELEANWSNRAQRRDAVVQLVHYLPQADVDIRRGENAGRRISYVNIVTGIEVVGRWNSAGPLKLTLRDLPDGHAVILIQENDFGPILAAAHVR